MTNCFWFAGLAAAANPAPAPAPPSERIGCAPPLRAAAAKSDIPVAPRLSTALLESSVGYGLAEEVAPGARGSTKEIAAWVMSLQATCASGYCVVCQTAQ